MLALIAKLVSAKITTLTSAKVEASLAQTKDFVEAFLGNIRGRAVSLTESVRDHKSALRRMIDCEGFAYIDGDDIVKSGVVPSREILFALRHYLQDEAVLNDRAMFVSDATARLSTSLAQLSADAAGVLAMRVNEQWFIWMRREQVRSVLWAGDPDSKRIYQDSSGAHMSPRLSFESWKEQVRGQSLSWLQEDIDAIERLQQSLLDVFIKHHVLIQSHPDGKATEGREHGADRFAQALQRSARADAAALQKQFNRDDVSA